MDGIVTYIFNTEYQIPCQTNYITPSITFMFIVYSNSQTLK